MTASNATMTTQSRLSTTLLATAFCLISAFSEPAFSEDEPTISEPSTPSTMTLDRMEDIIARLDSGYEREGSVINFSYANRSINVIADATADRMRVVIPITNAAALNEESLVRVLQANFDSALDARYAVAQGILWSTFIHRLSSLDDQDFLSGIGQTINTAESFGTSYSSGELVFGGGDSNDILRRQLIDELQRKGTLI